MAEEAGAEEVKWLNHYSSMQEILIVGDGDFSFTLSLANAFGSATNIVATSLDSHEILLKQYSKAKQNLESLLKMGAVILHGIDATKLKLYADLKMRKFDRIVFNFPHAGFKGKEDQIRLINRNLCKRGAEVNIWYLFRLFKMIQVFYLHKSTRSCLCCHNLYSILSYAEANDFSQDLQGPLTSLHRRLVSGFFRNARHLLRPHGEIDVSHKTGGPFCKWNLEELGAYNSLVLTERVKFRIEDYTGYHNKRGDGRKCDQPFPLGECSTYKFRIGHIPKKKALSNPLSVCGSHVDAAPGIAMGSGGSDSDSDGHSLSLVYPRGDYSLQEARPMTQLLINVQGTPGSGPTMTANRCNGNSVIGGINPVLDHLRYLEDLHRRSIMRQAELCRMLFSLDQVGRGPM